MSVDGDVESSLAHRRTAPIDVDARVAAGDQSPAALWDAIATSDGFERRLVDAVRTLLAGTPHHERVETLRAVGVTAGEGGYARQLVGFERAPETSAYARARAVTRQFGQGEVTPFGHRLAFDDLLAGPLPVLDATDEYPTIAVSVGQSFRDRRREQREATCRLLAILATVCDVTLVATDLTVRWLAREHGDVLPSSFSEQYTSGGETDTTVAEAVDAAREQFPPDSRAVRLLRDLASEPGETLSYNELTALHDVSDGRVSQLVGALADASLVERYGSQQHRQVDLLPAGRAFLAALDADSANSSDAAERFSDTGQDTHRDVLPAPRGKAPPDAPAGDTAPSDEPTDPTTATPYRTRYLGRAAHAGAAAAASSGDITAVAGSLPECAEPSDRHTRFVSYDDARDEAVVAVHASTPLQYVTSLALGLASPRLFDKALPPARLASIDDSAHILRDARCIGGLSAEGADDPQVFRDRLIEWGEDLAEMTTKLHREEYDDRDQLCGEILRSAHGLAGTIVHLLDAADVDVVREVRVPSLTDDQMASLARTLSVSAAIQSRYGAFASYRQLYESRDHKRADALSPTVDAADPLGEFIGSLVLRGPAADRLGYHVEGTVSAPAPVHDDAPEFAVPVRVSTPGREAYTAAVNRMLATKNIRATPEAVTMFQALAGDVYAVTEGIRWLGSEDQPRTIRLDEVRVSLSALSPSRILPDAPPSVSKALSALLEASRPLSRTDLADEADISTRSLRRHIDALVALDIVRETDDGYRLALPFSDSERGKTVLPAAVDEERQPQSVIFDLALALVDVDDAGRLGTPADPLGAPFFGPGLEIEPLQRHLPGSNPYLSVVLTLCRVPMESESTVLFGAQLSQTSLQEVTPRSIAM